MLLVRATQIGSALPIWIGRAAEHAGLGEFGLLTEPDTGQVDVTLRRRHVRMPCTGLQRGRTDPCGGCVRQMAVTAIMERADRLRDLRLRQRESERGRVLLHRQRATRLGMAEHTIVITTERAPRTMLKELIGDDRAERDRAL